MITKIRIRNFRSFKDTTVNLKPFNVFVGPNDSGKSNFLDAFLVLREMMWHNLSDVFSHRSYFFDDVIFKCSRNRIISFDVEGKTEVPKKPFEFRYSVKISSDKERQLHISTESLQIKEEGSNRWSQYIHRLGEKTQVKEKVKGKKGLLSYHFEDDKCAISLLSDLRRHAYIKSVARELKFSWFYYLRPNEMKKPSEMKGETNPVLDMYGRNLSNVLLYLQKNHPDKFKDLKNSLKDAIPNVKDLEVITREKWIFVFIINNQSEMFKLSNVSDGLIRFLGILSVVYNPMSPSMLFFEELENGIHPHRLQIAVELIRFLSIDPQFSQIFITTHSPYLVDCVKNPKDVFVVDKISGVSTIKSIWRKPGIAKFLNEFSLGEAWFSGALGGIP
ncbi:AAA family ATPase [candidate division WOR-3 bacterium]|nr:AAA family ATPase [candidate division WOR-3 bacterium]